MAPPRVTVKDVARRAGVHASTVSRALNPATRSMVTEAVALRVREAAKQLGYRPNPIASSLRTNRTMTVGVVIPDLTNPFFPPVIRGIEDALGTDGYTAIIANTDNDPLREAVTVERMRARRVDGLILATARRHDAVIDACRADGLPLVLVNRTTDADGIAAIVNDDATGIGLAVAHLASLGHHRIAYLGGPLNTSTGSRRESGFRSAMDEAGLTVSEDLVAAADAFREEDGRRGCEALLDGGGGFTAIVTANDMLAVGCYDVFCARGIVCPRDISITGFNDMPFADRLTPSLTTVRVRHYEMGARAGEMLLALLRNDDDAATRISLPAELVVRASTAAPSSHSA